MNDKLDDLLIEKNKDTGKVTIYPQKSEWTARHKKRAIYNVEKDGKKTSIPVMQHLKQLSLDLPSMNDVNGRRVYHFENLKRRFMSGKTKEQSMSLVNEYCSEIAEIYNEAIKKAKK